MNATPPLPTTTAAPARIAGLDGLRALAIVTVVVFHLFPGTLVGGFVGVDVFFVVSGFLITTLLLRERARSGRIALRAFWVRRARRLLPALVLVVVAAGTAALLVGGDPLLGLGTQVLGAATFSSNWLLISAGTSYFTEDAPELLRHLWSLAVEEQFYLVWPLVVALVLVRIPRAARVAGLAVLSAASALGMALLVDPADPTRVYFGTDTHAFGLRLGALVAVLSVDRGPVRPGAARPLTASGVLAVAGLVALAALLDGDQTLAYRGGLAAVAALTAVAIAALRVDGSVLARGLEVAPIRWVGERSYGLYLWHWPAIVLLTAAWPEATLDPLTSLARGAAALAITVVGASLSYRLLEMPIRRLGFRGALRAIPAGRLPGLRVATAAVAGLVGIALAAGTALGVTADPGRSEAQRYIEAGEAAIAAAPPRPAPEPTATAPAGPATGAEITAIGDSVMLAAAPTLQAEFPGISIDAAVSRSMYVAPDIVRAQLAAGTLRRVVVLALGTNGPIERRTLDEVRRLIGPERELVVVNAQAPRDWIPGVNSELSRFALVYRNVELANWFAAIQPDLDELAGDQIHFGPFGARVFTGAVADAVQRLADLPPLRDESDDLALPTPF